LEGRARALAGRLQAALGGRAAVDVEPGISSVGGGSLPGQELPTFLVRLTPPGGGEESWACRLRRHRPAVLGRCQDGALVLDLRTVAADEEDTLARALEATAP
ncbi:MAG TPA: L-seryl-tRNA(Sec) selenium transferase, partial [Candidatus Nitrosotenuis sp.]|nr:L-seryl-tRNA(Sec) selenium transferase [Candidatus Nitrosotenuis sp.]